MIHCFYHSADLDGHCSGAIVKYRFPDAVMHPINYGDEFPWDDIESEDEVYMVDFSMQPFNLMVKLGKRQKTVVTWIDHHSSALGEYRTYFSESSPAVYFSGIRDTSKAACELTWEYLFPNKPVPLAVKLLSLYDSGTHQGHELEDMVLPFQMRMRMEELNPKDWDGPVEKGGTGPKWHNLFMQGISTAYTTDLDYWIKEGRLLLRYDEKIKADYARTYAFETELLTKVSLGWPFYEPKTYKAIAINLGYTNSKVFDSVWRKECPECSGGGMLYDCLDHTGCVSDHKLACPTCHNSGYLEPYDLMITFVRRTDKLWNVILYSTKPEIDCGTIAKSFGGGGHKGAAGFQAKELPFDY